MRNVLNKNQLQHISNLIKMKGINYYDVNMEMTDHVASEVEEEMDSSGLEYMKAVKKVFLRYGRFHFMKIEEEQQKKLQKQSWKQAWESFLQFFTIPKILTTFGLFFVSKMIIESGFGSYIWFFFGGLVVVASSVSFYLKRKWIGKENYLQLNKFHSGFSLLYQIVLQVMIRLSNSPKYVDNPFLIAAFVTFSFLILFVTVEIYLKELLNLRIQLA